MDDKVDISSLITEEKILKKIKQLFRMARNDKERLFKIQHFDIKDGYFSHERKCFESYKGSSISLNGFQLVHKASYDDGRKELFLFGHCDRSDCYIKLLYPKEGKLEIILSDIHYYSRTNYRCFSGNLANVPQNEPEFIKTAAKIFDL